MADQEIVEALMLLCGVLADMCCLTKIIFWLAAPSLG